MIKIYYYFIILFLNMIWYNTIQNILSEIWLSCLFLRNSRLNLPTSRGCRRQSWTIVTQKRVAGKQYNNCEYNQIDNNCWNINFALKQLNNVRLYVFLVRFWNFYRALGAFAHDYVLVNDLLLQPVHVEVILSVVVGDRSF